MPNIETRVRLLEDGIIKIHGMLIQINMVLENNVAVMGEIDEQLESIEAQIIEKSFK